MRPAVYLLLALLPLTACELEVVTSTDGSIFDAEARADAHEPAPDAGPPEDLDGYVQWEMEAHGIAGLAAAILRDDEVLWQGTFGLADVEAGRAVTDRTLFAVASISKTIVAVPLMQLVEQGMVDLDAPLEDYFSFAVRHPSFPDVPITTRMLLTHTSGLEDEFRTLASVMEPGAPTLSLAEFSEQYVTPGGSLYTDANWGAAPGTRWSYCNAAFALVGLLVEVVGGQTLPQQTRSGLLEPLGMDDSAWFYTDADPALLATGYTWNARTGYTALEPEGLAYYPAGSFVTSLGELSLFLRSFVGFGAVDGVRVLEEATARAMRERPFADLHDGQALAWRYRSLDGRTYLGHSGATLGGSANMMFRPEDGTAIILLTNSDAYVLDRLGLSEGADALRRILRRLDQQSDHL